MLNHTVIDLYIERSHSGSDDQFVSRYKAVYLGGTTVPIKQATHCYILEESDLHLIFPVDGQYYETDNTV
jgi:hypothetical protein